MEKNNTQIKTIEKTLKFLEKLPEKRRLFYNTGILLIEVSKREAEKILKKKLEGLRGNTKNKEV